MSRLLVLAFPVLILTVAFAANAENVGARPSAKVKRGQTIRLVLITPLDSAYANIGDEVSAKLERPLVADGATVLPADWIVHGTVTKVKRAGKNCHSGQIKWKLTTVTAPNGDRLAVQQVFSYPFNPNHTGDPDWVPLDTVGTKIRRKIVFVGVVAIFVALSPFTIPMAIAMAGENPCHGEPGQEKLLQAGKSYLYAVSKDTHVVVGP